MPHYYVYIMASQSKVLYAGFTSDLERRVRDHMAGDVEGFTKRYRVNRLVYFEETRDVRAAMTREKQIKGWRREKKIALVERSNPEWRNLGADLVRHDAG